MMSDLADRTEPPSTTVAIVGIGRELKLSAYSK